MGRAYEVRKASIMKTGAAKAKLYSNFAKEIYLAAKKGVPEIESNIALKRLVEKAKKNQVPSDIINRAIEKAKGVGGEDYQEVTYEGFGPGSSTLIIKCLTDNVNRTVGEVRAAFNKVNKSLGVTNSVSYNYDYVGVLSFISQNSEELFEELLNEGIEIIDYEDEEGYINITIEPHDYNKVKDVVEKIIPEVDYEVDQIGMFPKEKTTLTGEDKEVFEKLYNMLDNIDDVTEIYHNVNIDL
ncbi:MAG: YebC/PmpR family DNA-binding transcriptional regulator [Bacilli bacterium]|nr:YebC/PmpR family DNA-binding transcriptional regulator [Bacilli bacterium]MBQ8902120.1 YebC/PmpR family DNA-binding transcriptional regulator [Bacilli bacterium]